MRARRHTDLQRYFDEELSQRRARKLHEHLASSPEDQRQLDDLKKMRSLLQEATEEAVAEVSFEHLWSNVQEAIATQQPLTLKERINTWARRYGLVAVSAAAAVVLVFFLLVRPFGEPSIRNDCHIESLEVEPGAVSTIFTIYTPEKSDRTTVIWVNDETSEGDVN